ncbi:hypothetical protein RM550_25620 [Streptomyces sp. DSM 41527]|uniref:WXG100 family type VII secretion target n=1 Tax=Streptomyces mooreae TaxID=3075523 RepID=A0ABU2TDQ3_9ACTN|nr:hypothetical protein [Streptomyces sp. DSM 41527]MDT0459054.1 hypothetical protein [Streptomyces sp. DSM 41527]
MVTYEQLYHLDLSRLESAIEAWGTQIHHLESLDDAFTQDVSKRFSQAGWNSLDLTSTTAASQLEDADKEITDAVTEAKGIHAILRDAHSRLQKNKADLHKLADVEAPDRGLVVGSTGRVEARNDTTQDLPNQDDPDNEELRALQKRKLEDFSLRIQEILADAEETDNFASQALHSNTDGKPADGFKGKVYTSISSYKKAFQKGDRVGTHTLGAKPWGSGTIKPVAEFLSYKSWINAGDSALHGRVGEAWDYFVGGTPPNAVAGMAKTAGMKLGAGGGPVANKISSGIIKGAGKIFGVPVSIAATFVDYAYSPESDSKKLEQQSRNLGPDKINPVYGEGKSRGESGPIA